jgi:hypothetical protein
MLWLSHEVPEPAAPQSVLKVNAAAGAPPVFANIPIEVLTACT